MLYEIYKSIILDHKKFEVLTINSTGLEAGGV
jgi:hypothetical protein